MFCFFAMAKKESVLSPYPTNSADHILAPAGANPLERDSRDYFASAVNQKAASWFAVTSVGNGFTESRKQRRTEWTNMIRTVYPLSVISVNRHPIAHWEVLVTESLVFNWKGRQNQWRNNNFNPLEIKYPSSLNEQGINKAFTFRWSVKS